MTLWDNKTVPRRMVNIQSAVSAMYHIIKKVKRNEKIITIITVHIHTL